MSGFIREMSGGSPSVIISHAEAELIQHIEEIAGWVPDNVVDLLEVLSHRDVIEFTRRYLDKRTEHYCEQFEAGWTCADEVAVHVDRAILQGYPGVLVGFDWCEPCQQRELNQKQIPSGP